MSLSSQVCFPAVWCGCLLHAYTSFSACSLAWQELLAVNKSRILAVERRVCSGAPMSWGGAHTIVRVSQSPGLLLGTNMPAPAFQYSRQRRTGLMSWSLCTPTLAPGMHHFQFENICWRPTLPSPRPGCWVCVPRGNRTLPLFSRTSQSDEREGGLQEHLSQEAGRQEGSPCF